MPDPRPAAVRPLCIAVAQQAFNNEYVFSEDDREITAIQQVTAQLDDALASGHRELAERLFLQRGLYRAPATISRFTDLAELAPAFHADLQGLVARCVNEPMEERRLRREVVHFGKANDASRAVRQHYEDSPYPRWLRLP